MNTETAKLLLIKNKKELKEKIPTLNKFINLTAICDLLFIPFVLFLLYFLENNVFFFIGLGLSCVFYFISSVIQYVEEFKNHSIFPNFLMPFGFLRKNIISKYIFSKFAISVKTHKELNSLLTATHIPKSITDDESYEDLLNVLYYMYKNTNNINLKEELYDCILNTNQKIIEHNKKVENLTKIDKNVEQIIKENKIDIIKNTETTIKKLKILQI